MANVDEITAFLNLPLPVFSSNTQDFDVPRLAEALMIIDAAMQALNGALAGKAATAHQHEINQVLGLVEALAGKMPGNWRPTLDELTDVDVAAGANGQFLKKVGSNWIAAALQLGDVTGWQDTVNALISSAIAGTVGAAPAALDTLYELAAALGNDPNFANTVSSALGNRLRFDAAQSLSSGQKVQALGNLGVSTLIQTLLDDTTQDQALGTLGVGAGLRGLRAHETAAAIWAALKVAATTADAGVVRKATPSELLAGTADRFPDAATMRQLLPKVVLNADCNANPPTIRRQLNVASVVRNSGGNFTINFAAALANADYGVNLTVSDPGALQVGAATITGQAVDSLSIRCMAANASANGTFNPSTVCLTIFEVT